MPRFSDPVIAPAFIGAHIPNSFGVTFYVGNTTNPGEDQGSSGVTPRQQGRSPKNPFATIAAAVTEAVGGRGDTIIIQRGTYTETVNFSKAGLTVMASPNYGPDHVVIKGASTVSADGCSFVGVEFFSNSTTAACMESTFGADANSLLFYRCSFSSDGTTEPLYGLRLRGGNNLDVQECFFTDCTNGLQIIGGTSAFPADIMVKGCVFRENTTADLLGGTMNNVNIVDNYFAGGLVLPTRFISIGAGTGLIAGNRFASATNSSTTIVIPSTILYAANATEAGWSTARPA